MTLLDSTRLCIYRCHEKGLEILLVRRGQRLEEDGWTIPVGRVDTPSHRPVIELDSINDASGNSFRALAIEGDWHDIPSIRALLKHDVVMVRDKIKESVTELERGAYFDIKEAFKKVLPNEYQALKELKDILLDRNTVINM